MKCYNFVSLCLAICLSLVCVFTIVSLADEPNDTFETADHLLIGLENGITSDLTADDTDYYSFTVNADDVIAFSTYNVRNADPENDNATGIWLYDADGNSLQDDDYGSDGLGNENASFSYTFVVGGTYYLAVRDDRSVAWEGEYSIRALRSNDPERLNWSTENEISFEEPNNFYFGLAYPVEVGYNNAITTTLYDSATFVSNNAENDIYSFYGQTDITYVIQTYDIINANPDENRATGLWLYGSDAVVLDNDQYGTKGHANVNAQIIFRPTVDGTYYINVAARSGYSWSGQYSFRILVDHTQPNFMQDAETLEPNDHFPTASALPFGRDGIRSALSNPASWVSAEPDQDTYTFDAQAGQPFIIQTFNIINTSTDDNDATRLWLYDSEGNVIENDQYGGNGNVNVNAQISHLPAVDGRFYVLVANDNSWEGDYSIRIMNTFTSDLAAWDSESLEPNSNFGLAYPISIGNEGITSFLDGESKWVSQREDTDIFVFDGVADETYTVQTLNIINTDPTDNNATGIYIYDEQLNEISVNDYIGRGGHNNVNAQVIFTPSASGKFYVQVIDYDNWRGDYTVRVLPSHTSGESQFDAMQEPNDELPLAYPLSVSPIGVTSNIDHNPAWVSSRYDVDYFTFDAEANTDYTIRTYGIDNYLNDEHATAIWLYDLSWNELAEDIYGRNGEGEANAEIVFNFPIAGTYYVAVAPDSSYDDWVGTYSICVVQTGTACEVAPIVPLAVTMHGIESSLSILLITVVALFVGVSVTSLILPNKR